MGHVATAERGDQIRWHLITNPGPPVALHASRPWTEAQLHIEAHLLHYGTLDYLPILPNYWWDSRALLSFAASLSTDVAVPEWLV